MSLRRRGQSEPLGQYLSRRERESARNRPMDVPGAEASYGPDGWWMEPSGQDVGGSLIAWATSTINPASGTTSPLTPGTGTVHLGRMNGSGQIVADTLVNVPVWNWATVTWTSGTKLRVGYMYQKLFVLGAEC
jgi:hypothetical protein